MGATAPRPRIDERAMGAGTTARFALLVVLMLAAGGAMMLPVVKSLHRTDAMGCSLATGIDPDRGGDMASVINALSQAVAYRGCMAKYAPPPAQWLIYSWPVLLSVTATLLFFLLPVWKARHRSAVPLESADSDGEIQALLTDLAATAGLARLPRVVVDRASIATGAVVFGRNRRPTVCLFGGLLACRRSDPERFRAVILHEFAHIANRDITVTYGTVAVWRVFLALVLLPYLVWSSRQVHGFLTWGEPSDVPSLTRVLLLPALTVALVYLARSDVLRSREIYADLAAVRWGADPHKWDVTARPTAGGRLRGALGSLRGLWGTHPRWEERRGALADPAPLFGARALPMFLTGAAAAMVNIHLLTYLSTYDLYSLWRVQLVSLTPATLVAGVIGTALWRSVSYAVLTGDQVPSGVRAGLWLGAGFGVGGLFTGYGLSGAQWLPQRPALLLLVVCAGVAFAWWVTQCARLWAGTWRGRSLRPPLLVGLGSATLVLAAWFAWWTMDGSSWAAGASYSSSGMRQGVLDVFPGSGVASASGDTATDRSAVVTAMAAVWPILGGFVASPLIPAAIAALWVVPLTAWALGRAPGTPRWVSNALPGGGGRKAAVEEPLPPLRRALRPGALGGAACWLAVAGAQALLPAPPTGPQQRVGVHEVHYLAWLFVALVVPAAVAAAVAARSGRGRRLVAALIAAESAALLGLVGMVLLVSSDGCVGPLNTLESSCSWHPVWDTMSWTLPRLVNSVLVLAAVSAFLVAAAGSLVRRVRPRGKRGTDVSGEEPVHSGGRAAGARRLGGHLGTVMAVVAAMAVAVVEPVSLAKYHTMVPDAATTQRTARQWMHVTVVTVSADTRARQVHAWHRLGGRYLLEHAKADNDYLRAVLRSAVDTKNIRLPYLARLRPTCADYGRIAGWVDHAYFRVPDREAQAAWQALGLSAQKGSTDCERALKQQDITLFVSAMRELGAAGNSTVKVTSRVDTVLREAGYEDYLSSTRKAREPGW
ncbi:M48 family metallopeptidase [Streptomyces sp. NPDC014724]|uniref:M48 family metallopeptidase n=1 Tax=unclassified Streptomyces TaxID=2593676 RepID=UPI0036FC1852